MPALLVRHPQQDLAGGDFGVVFGQFSDGREAGGVFQGGQGLGGGEAGVAGVLEVADRLEQGRGPGGHGQAFRRLRAYRPKPASQKAARARVAGSGMSVISTAPIKPVPFPVSITWKLVPLPVTSPKFPVRPVA